LEVPAQGCGWVWPNFDTCTITGKY
jgi:hypothetical protein